MCHGLVEDCLYSLMTNKKNHFPLKYFLQLCPIITVKLENGVCVYVVYKDTHLYNDMDTGITRR